MTYIANRGVFPADMRSHIGACDVSKNGQGDCEQSPSKCLCWCHAEQRMNPDDCFRCGRSWDNHAGDFGHDFAVGEPVVKGIATFLKAYQIEKQGDQAIARNSRRTLTQFQGATGARSTSFHTAGTRSSKPKMSITWNGGRGIISSDDGSKYTGGGFNRNMTPSTQRRIARVTMTPTKLDKGIADIIKGNQSGKTEHSGPKKGVGAYWGRKADAKAESNTARRAAGKKSIAEAIEKSVPLAYRIRGKNREIGHFRGRGGVGSVIGSTGPANKIDEGGSAIMHTGYTSASAGRLMRIADRLNKPVIGGIRQKMSGMQMKTDVAKGGYEEPHDDHYEDFPGDNERRRAESLDRADAGVQAAFERKRARAQAKNPAKAAYKDRASQTRYERTQTCGHGLDASLCHGPQHYGDEWEGPMMRSLNKGYSIGEPKDEDLYRHLAADHGIKIGRKGQRSISSEDIKAGMGYEHMATVSKILSSASKDSDGNIQPWKTSDPALALRVAHDFRHGSNPEPEHTHYDPGTFLMKPRAEKSLSTRTGNRPLATRIEQTAPKKPLGARIGTKSAQIQKSMCEDYPACGHGPEPYGDSGGCPDAQGRFNCVTCGDKMPRGATSAICKPCKRNPPRRDDLGMTDQDRYDDQWSRSMGIAGFIKARSSFDTARTRAAVRGARDVMERDDRCEECGDKSVATGEGYKCAGCAELTGACNCVKKGGYTNPPPRRPREVPAEAVADIEDAGNGMKMKHGLRCTNCQRPGGFVYISRSNDQGGKLLCPDCYHSRTGVAKSVTYGTRPFARRAVTKTDEKQARAKSPRYGMRKSCADCGDAPADVADDLCVKCAEQASDAFVPDPRPRLIADLTQPMKKGLYLAVTPGMTSKGLQKSLQAWPKCPGCNKVTDMLGMLDTRNPVCMKCVTARARTAGHGRCKCGRLANPGKPVDNGQRQWVPCRRCLGHFQTLNDVCSKCSSRAHDWAGHLSPPV